MRKAAVPRNGGQHSGSRTSFGRWRKRGTQKQAIGRSRGGPTTKIHALCDQLGRLYALMLTGGQVHDIWGARSLLSSVAMPARFLGDKAYDADDIRDYLAAGGSEAVIPSKANRKEPKPHDGRGTTRGLIALRTLPLTPVDWSRRAELCHDVAIVVGRCG